MTSRKDARASEKPFIVFKFVTSLQKFIGQKNRVNTPFFNYNCCSEKIEVKTKTARV